MRSTMWYTNEISNMVCTEICECVMHLSKCTNVLCSKTDGSISVHNYVIQIVLVIKWYSFLSTWCQDHRGGTGENVENHM